MVGAKGSEADGRHLGAGVQNSLGHKSRINGSLQRPECDLGIHSHRSESLGWTVLPGMEAS
jgi:hypothetical protein